MYTIYRTTVPTCAACCDAYMELRLVGEKRFQLEGLGVPQVSRCPSPRVESAGDSGAGNGRVLKFCPYGTLLPPE